MLKPILYALALAGLLVPVLTAARTSYVTPELDCAAAYPVVSLGNAGRFTAVATAPGPFMWSTNDLGFVDAGSVFVAPMTELGVQQVTVIWGSRRASCYVEVVPMPGYGEPFSPSFYQPYDGQGPRVTLTSALYPSWPHAGFAPHNAAALAFAVVLLLGTSIALYPYARQALAAVTR
ncbi:MAG: hypothetical protein JWL87_93 [Candidatus Adlerbacteria bacterium]|nr:hypothetical protein [Candidatus Adlerbacteria bacterium]